MTNIYFLFCYLICDNYSFYYYGYAPIMLHDYYLI